MSTILITDSLFIGAEHEQLIRDAGFDIERLDTPTATEEQLIAAITGKVGYILGGVETVSTKVIEAANDLKAIAFTGSGYQEFIPAWKEATERGIAISAARGANAESVAEFALACALAQIRQIPNLMSSRGSSFSITHEFSELKFGIVGYGLIGRALAKKARALGFEVVATAAESDEVVTHSSLQEILPVADVLSVHVSKGRGDGVLGASEIAGLKNGAILVNAAFKDAIDNGALVDRLRAGSLSAALDYPLEADGLPIGALLVSNGQTGFNTVAGNQRTSDRATSSLLGLLGSADHPDLVNPEFIQYR